LNNAFGNCRKNNFAPCRFAATPNDYPVDTAMARPLHLDETMKFMLLIYSNEKAWAEGEREQCFVQSTALTHELHKQGKYLGASPLHPVATTTSVRVRQGKRQVTDGPFAETQE
jgi:YCII-related domain